MRNSSILRRSHFKKIPLFSELTNQEIQLIVTHSKEQGYPKGSIVFYEGDPGDFLLIILSGRVKVVLFGEEEKEVILAILGPGSFFGEMAVLDATPRSATVQTLEPSLFLHIDQEKFSSLVKKHPQLSLKIMKHLTTRLREANEQIGSLAMFDVYGKIARCLLSLGKTQGIRTKNHLVVQNKPSNRDLGYMVGCSRETISRAMQVLQRGGYLTVNRKEIIILRSWQK